jgi:hypothetical protein
MMLEKSSIEAQQNQTAAIAALAAVDWLLWSGCCSGHYTAAKEWLL